MASRLSPSDRYEGREVIREARDEGGRGRKGRKKMAEMIR
jgi:hypothetical protein